VVLVLLAALAAPFLIPVDQYRPLLVWAIESGTGRTVQIDALKLVLFPTVRIRLLNVRMKNPRGFPAGDALVAGTVDLGIAPRALLSRQLDVTDIAPSGVQVNVLRDAAGRTNFAAPVPLRTAAQGASAAAEPPITLEHIGAVTVSDAQITFADAPGTTLPAPSLSLRGVSGTIGAIDPQARDWAKELKIVVDLRGAQLTTELLTAPIEFHTGQLAFAEGGARGVFSSSVGGIDLAGNAAIARLDHMSIAFAVAGPELDLQRLATILRVGEHGGTAALTPRYLLAHGTIKLGKVRASPVEASGVTGQLDLYRNGIRLNAFTLSGYGGTARGRATLDTSDGVPTSVTARASGINVQQALAALGLGQRRVTGALDANFTLTTLLTRDPESSLRAAGSFTVRNGSFPGMNVAGQLAATARLIGLAVPSGDTRFSSFGGDLAIARERGYSNQLTLIGSGLRATLRGSFGFDQTLAYGGTAVVVPTRQTALAGSPALASLQAMLGEGLRRDLGGSSVSMPFSLRGTLDHPQFTLAGTPQLLGTPGTGSTTQPPPALPTLQDLEKLIPKF